MTHYVLFYGTSADGLGVPRPTSLTTDKAIARQHLANIANDPYAFGHVLVFHQGEFMFSAHYEDAIV